MSEYDRPSLTRRDFLIGLAVAAGVLTPLAVVATQEPAHNSSPKEPKTGKKEETYSREAAGAGAIAGAIGAYKYSKIENAHSKASDVGDASNTAILTAAGGVLGASAGQIVGQRIKK